MTQPFLARKEEQERFQGALRSLLPPMRVDNDSPFVFLFSGEGGMGKSRLLHQLQEIAARWEPFEGEFNLLYVDWEARRGISRDLQVGHDNIRPESILDILHRELIQRFKGLKLGEYDKVVQALQKAEEKIDAELKSTRESELYSRLRKWGPKGIALLVRGWAQQQGSPLEPLKSVPQELLEDAAGLSLDTGEATLKVYSEKAREARDFVNRLLTPFDFDLYARPHEHLARALGRGIKELSGRRPLVIFQDTYEIVDRPECDYTVREAISSSGGRVIWVIAGRTNLAESGRRGNDYFRGYRQDFGEERLYAKAITEFGPKEIKQYFQETATNRSLSSSEAEAIAEFTLGIPFAVSAAAALWDAGATLKEIVAPIVGNGDEPSIHTQIIKQISERFLAHCLGPDQRDLRAIYALALMRRPDADLLRAMLDISDPEDTLQALHLRYSFIWVDQIRLDEKISRYLNEYLLAEIRRKSALLQEPNERAIDFLKACLAERTKDVQTLEQLVRDEGTVELVSDLTHHLFWKGEEDGFHYLISHFIEALQYDPEWARGLLAIARRFYPTFSKQWRILLNTLSAGAGPSTKAIEIRQMLDELESGPKRKWWKGEGEAERTAILLFQRGGWLFRKGRSTESLQKYLEAERTAPAQVLGFLSDLATAINKVGVELGLQEGSVIASVDSRTAFQHAVRLNPVDVRAWCNLGRAQTILLEIGTAFESFSKALQIEPEDAGAYDGLGELYTMLGRYDKAIESFNRSIGIAPNSSDPYIGLGEVYIETGQFDESLVAFTSGIELDPSDATGYNWRGWVYLSTSKLAEAELDFQNSIKRNPSNYYPPTFNLGLVRALQGNVSEARRLWQRALSGFQGNTPYDLINQAILDIAAGNTSKGHLQLRGIIEEPKKPGGLIDYALHILRMIGRCSPKVDGFDGVEESLNNERLKRSVGGPELSAQF